MAIPPLLPTPLLRVASFHPLTRLDRNILTTDPPSCRQVAAVEIRASRNEQVVPRREVQEVRCHRRRVVGVVRFQTLKTCFDQRRGGVAPHPPPPVGADPE